MGILVQWLILSNVFYKKNEENFSGFRISSKTIKSGMVAKFNLLDIIA